mmetsp:Transcript_132993/g.244561  ORF Transcript_132993/g.244561 Transcript_132993/m.244561 type:complete len:1088 (-) Transcript_132993:119-3382(-)
MIAISMWLCMSRLLLHLCTTAGPVAFAASDMPGTCRSSVCGHQLAEPSAEGTHSEAVLGSSLLQRDYQRSSIHDLQDTVALDIARNDTTAPTTLPTLLQHAEKTEKSQHGSNHTMEEQWRVLRQKEQDVQQLLRQLEAAQEELNRFSEEQSPDNGDETTVKKVAKKIEKEIRKVIDKTTSDDKDGDKPDDNKHSGEKAGSVYVPFPYFLHDKEHTLQHVVGPYGTPLLGDSLEPTMVTDGHGKEVLPAQQHHHGRGYIVLLFLGGALVIGCVLQMLLHALPLVPYTCGLFLVGIFVSWIHWLNQADTWWQWKSWYTSVEMWQGIDPHLLFYGFLPALLFGDVMKTKVQLVRVSAGQIFMLACPGVLFGCLLTALFGKYVLPYHWDWPLCFVFGSILSATDPVAVVSLFGTLGVSEKLTMLVSGESLVNDGTAIVLFVLALKSTMGAEFHTWEVITFFAHMIITAVLAGLVVGLLSITLISACSEDHKHHDAMIQVVVTICCGYLAYFMSESELSSSGVVATVTSGICIAYSCWPLFVSRETVLTVWEAIEFIGNTVIFFLAGLIFGGAVLDAKSDLHLRDLGWLFALYGGIFVIRAIMMIVFWIPLNMVGSHLQWQEGCAMVWSGLRGAVSVAMGMIVDMEPQIPRNNRAQVLFHVGGIALLTLLFNSTTSGALLRALGLVPTKQVMARMDARFSVHLAHKVTESFERLRTSQDMRFNGANFDLVRAMVPALQIMAPRFFPSRDQHDAKLQWKLVQSYREIFLRVVQSRYWQGIHDGVIPRHLRVSRILLQSTDEAMDKTWDTLNDWDIIARNVNIQPPTKFQQFLSNLVDFPAFRHMYSLSGYSLEYQTMMHVYIALSYLDAHTYAQAMIPQCWGTDDALDFRVQKQVIHESNLQIKKVSALIAKLPAEAVEAGRSKMLARKLLMQQCHEINELHEGGIISRSEAEHLSEPCLVALRDIARLRSGSWRERVERVQYIVASSRTAAPAESREEPVRIIASHSQQPPGVTTDVRGTSTFGVHDYERSHPGSPTRIISRDPGAALRPGSGLSAVSGGSQQVLDPGVVLHPVSAHEASTMPFTSQSESPP